MTTADGQFSITTIVPGNYSVFVERRGYSSFTVSGLASGQNLAVKAGDRIKGTAVRLVPDAMIAGRVLDSRGIPAEAIDVTAVGIAQARSVRTDDRGRFRIGGLRPGRYLIRTFSYPDNLPPEIRTDGTEEVSHRLTYYPSSATAASAVAVEVRAGEETSGIEIKLLRSLILRVSGSVLNVPDGDPQQAQVEMVAGQTRWAARLGSDLKFTMWGVPPGRYQLFANCDSPKNGRLVSSPAEIDVSSTSIDGLTLALLPSQAIAGHVVVEGADTLTSLKGGASLRLQPLGGAQYSHGGRAFIANDGTFKIEVIFPFRYYSVGERLPGNFYVKSARIGKIESLGGVLDLGGLSSTEDELIVQLGTNGAEVSGVVRDAQGPVSGVAVAMFFDNDFGTDVFAGLHTGAKGSYLFHGVPPGKYRLLAWKDPDNEAARVKWSSDILALYQDVTESIEITEGDKISQDLKLLARP
jgi:hypothetical protein